MRYALLVFALTFSSAAFSNLESLEVKSLTDGKIHTLRSLVGTNKLLVLIEQGNQCPVFRRYAPHIKELVAERKDKPVSFILINSFRKAEPQTVKKELEDLKLQLPAYLDVDQKIAKHFGLSTLSEVALVEASTSKLLYRGAIDDRVNYYYAKPNALKPYLKNAISAALAGSKISPDRTQPFGCAISFD